MAIAAGLPLPGESESKRDTDETGRPIKLETLDENFICGAASVARVAGDVKCIAQAHRVCFSGF